MGGYAVGSPWDQVPGPSLLCPPASSAGVPPGDATPLKVLGLDDSQLGRGMITADLTQGLTVNDLTASDNRRTPRESWEISVRKLSPTLAGGRTGEFLDFSDASAPHPTSSHAGQNDGRGNVAPEADWTEEETQNSAETSLDSTTESLHPSALPGLSDVLGSLVLDSPTSPRHRFNCAELISSMSRLLNCIEQPRHWTYQFGAIKAISKIAVCFYPIGTQIIVCSLQLPNSNVMHCKN
ncbi:hypothetical protein MTO96_026719 [Rhipicephalus appendiculatus]